MKSANWKIPTVLFIASLLIISPFAAVSMAEGSNTPESDNVSASFIQNIVDELDNDGEFADSSAPHALEIHLQAVGHYEDQNEIRKVVDHMGGFQDLLDHQVEEQLITDEGFDVLYALSDDLIQKYEVSVYPGIQYQTHEGFGTSLAWFGNVVGGFSDENREEIADLLFDPEDGLGMNVVRYNIGGGDHPDQDWLRVGADVPGYQPEKGMWDWSADPNQRWVLEAAKDRSGDDFIAEAFSNSPPYWMTYSNTSSGNFDGYEDNLKTEYYEDFVEYLTKVVQHFDEELDIQFRTINPFNEPGHHWEAYNSQGQEGAHFSVSTHEEILHLLYDSLNQKDLDTQISAMDAKDIWDTISQWNQYSDTTQSYVNQINAHGYHGDKTSRNDLNNIANQHNNRLWMSEADTGGATDPWELPGYKPDDMEPALNLSEMMTSDLRELKPDAWVFWQAVENKVNNISEGDGHTWGLIHANFEGEGAEGLEEEEWRTNKKFYGFGQYSRFIRPGFQQIHIDQEDAVAFRGEEEGRLVIVETNHNDSGENVSYNLSDFDVKADSVEVHRTSETEDLAQLSDLSVDDDTFTAHLPSHSITTFVIDDIHYSND